MTADLERKMNNFETEVTNRNKEISELRTKLEATETGGLHLSAYGVVWIFIGVIMSTFTAVRLIRE
jgi:hypothetical protein